MSSEKVNFQTHEEIILEGIQSKRLFNILFPLVKNKQNSLEVKINSSEGVELMELGSSKRWKDMKKVVV